MADQTRTDDKSKSSHARLVTEIRLYEQKAKIWEDKGKKILKRYKDERSVQEDRLPRYNILWSNIQTLAPALFAKNPKPNIERRFKDNDVLSRVTSEVLERATDYFINSDKFSMCMKQVVLDRLLPGRGTSWVRYVPHFKDMDIQGTPEEKNEGYEISDETNTDDEIPLEGEETPQEVDYEEVTCDYVHWEDFGHNIGARTWDEVYLGWRRVYFKRSECIARFGDEIGNKIPLDYEPKGLNDQKVAAGELKKATIYELWDKECKCVYWLHKDVEDILDEKDDPLKLPEFFPFPRPLLATTANDSLIPVPDYKEYQDQAVEIDELTARISSIKKALKVAGVYDSSAQGIERLLAEGVENQLVPVESWAVFSEKGGIAGAINFLPMKEIAETLLALIEARDSTKKDLYEITGMADIMRGATDPDETASAQRIKGQYVNLRLRASQDEVQRFARDMVRIIAQVIAEHFSLETIKEISGIKLLMAVEKQRLQMKIAPMQNPQQVGQASAPGQGGVLTGSQPLAPPIAANQSQPPMAGQSQPGIPNQSPQPPAAPPPIPEEIQEQLDNPTWEEVYALLRNDSLRSFRIDIETDSTIRADEDAEKDDRMQFLQAAGGFLQQAMAAGAQEPDLIPLMGEMLRFGVQAFRVSKPLEGAFNVAIAAMEKKASQNTGQPKPDPEQAKAQSDIAIKQAQAKLDNDQMVAQFQMDKEKAAFDEQLEEKRLKMQQEYKERDLQMQYAFKMKELQAKSAADGMASVDDGGMVMPGQTSLADTLMHLGNSVVASTQASQTNHTAMQQHLANHTQQIANLTKIVGAPKTLVRDKSGRAVGAVTQMQ